MSLWPYFSQVKLELLTVPTWLLVPASQKLNFILLTLFAQYYGSGPRKTAGEYSAQAGIFSHRHLVADKPPRITARGEKGSKSKEETSF